LRTRTSLSLTPPFRSLDPLKFLLQYRLEGVIPSREEHDIVWVYCFAAAVFGEDFEVAGCVGCMLLVQD
jgi:hypothetical protein